MIPTLKLDKEYAPEFNDFLNTLDPDIKFTTEGEEGALPFLDTNLVRKEFPHRVLREHLCRPSIKEK